MIVWDDGSDIRQIYDMWQRNFRDPVPYADFYFSEVYGHNKVLMNRMDDGLPVGMIHLNPYNLQVGGNRIRAHYIVGVATDEDYRRQGVMRGLLESAFSYLRGMGEAFTYLMPADEAYYLPFDFRFGMSQLEQEVIITGEPGESDLTFITELSEEDLTACAGMENEYKRDLFDISTLIDAAYLKRLQKEAISDFGRMYYVFRGEEYLGRFNVAVEYECLTISRIFAMGDVLTFVKDILDYCRREFHYTNVMIVMDESMEDCSGQKLAGDHVRAMPVRRVPKIMYRILDLEKLAPLLRSEADGSTCLYVEDHHLPDQNGLYRISCAGGRVDIKKEDTSGEEGRIRIGDLTAWLFGSMNIEELSALDGPGAGAECLKKICPLSASCVMEIV